MLKAPSYIIIFDLRDVLFSYHPEHRGTPFQFRVIKNMVALLHQIHAQVTPYGQKRHQLYVLSNGTVDSYHNFMTYHAEIFNYFDGIVMSAHSGFQKPDPNAYLYLLNKYNLSKESCIFIDDKQTNVSAAQSLGINGIVYTNSNQITQELKALQII